MWDDAKLWLPKVLNGGFVEATLTIGPDDTVVDATWTDTQGIGMAPGL
jgi:hypothetical protein